MYSSVGPQTAIQHFDDHDDQDNRDRGHQPRTLGNHDETTWRSRTARSEALAFGHRFWVMGLWGVGVACRFEAAEGLENQGRRIQTSNRQQTLSPKS